MVVRGIRGAITVAENSKEAITEGTRLLLAEMIKANDLQEEDIASAYFTVTDDLNADFPAHAARHFGWVHVPMLCTREIAVPGSLEKVVRVLLHINTDRSQLAVKHIYLRDAVKLRPDINYAN